MTEHDDKSEKNPAAVELGRLGGDARARKLSRRRRIEIASLAGRARKRTIPAARRQEIARLGGLARARKRRENAA